MGTARELDRVRRELRDATMPAKLAALAGGRGMLFDDRVEIDRSVIGLVAGATRADVTVSGSGRSAFVYLSVNGPDGSRTLRLRGEDEEAAREFAAAVEEAAARVDEVQAERARRIAELGARVASLTGSDAAPEDDPLVDPVVEDVVPPVPLPAPRPPVP